MLVVVISYSGSAFTNKSAQAISPNFANSKTLFSLSPTSTLARFLPSAQSPVNVEREIFKWFRTFSEAIHLIVQKHYKKVDIPSFIQDALKAALPKTDPHSSFFSQKSYQAALESTSGKFSGIGVSIINKAPEDDSLVIIDVIQGGPAHKAGLQPGDKIVGVNGESLKGKTADEVVSELRGETGTKVPLKILRKKKPLSISVTRDVIKDQNLICYHFEDQNIYYVSLKLFADNTHKQMTKILKQAHKNNYKGLIIDLRRNPGGVLDSAVNMVGLFVKKGSLAVFTKDKANNTVNSYHTQTRPILNGNKPIFVITDNFTASASEIFAGCLKHYSDQDHSSLAVYHIGTETFGKGSVQEVIPISNGCALKLTTMTYVLPNNVPIQAQGIKPDFVVQSKTVSEKETKWIKELYGKEKSLKNHIPSQNSDESEAEEPTSEEEEESKEELAKNWEERYRKSICSDTQIQACVNMIGLLNLQPKAASTREKSINFLKANYLTDETPKLVKIN